MVDTYDIRPSSSPPGYATDISAYGDGQFVKREDYEALVAVVRAADRLHADTMYKWAPEAKAAYIAARMQVEIE